MSDLNLDPSTVRVGPNEVLRFILELAALVALGYAGWQLGDGGPLGGGLAAALPLVAAGAWGILRVDGDPKLAPVPVKGIVRLCIEVDFFAAAVALLVVVGAILPAVVLGGLVVLHYAWGWRRIRWLIRHPGRLPEMRRRQTATPST